MNILQLLKILLLKDFYFICMEMFLKHNLVNKHQFYVHLCYIYNIFL